MTRCTPGQTAFAFRRYIVRCNGLDDCHVDAADVAGAKYEAFKRARDAGYFKDGFPAFIANGVTARADRRSLRIGNRSPELGL
ncbi:hypothetical protein [Bradyrhizobium sp. 5.13L]